MKLKGLILGLLAMTSTMLVACNTDDCVGDECLITPCEGDDCFCTLFPDEPECQPLPIEYFVTFDYNFTGAPAPIVEKIVGDGNKIARPADPVSLQSDTFVHWSMNRNEIAYDFNATVSSSFVLYAVWQKGKTNGPAPTSIEIQGPSRVVLNKTAELMISTLPLDTVDDVTWSTSDASVISVSPYGMIKGLKLGTATITAVSDAATNVSDTLVVEVIEKELTGWCIVGTFSDWANDISRAFFMTKNSSYKGVGTEYMYLGFEVTAGTEFKLYNSEDGRWISNGWEDQNGAFVTGHISLSSDGYDGYNVKVNQNCSLDIYFKDYGDGTYNCYIGLKT
ncbi:MAG: Ig-like domain-containing protein [Erysipelotrichaceae bacterium]|jgi:hypothetical protein|nr:Ig-like domain-containing protein [Erysipelotrichaceae bacterium]